MNLLPIPSSIVPNTSVFDRRTKLLPCHKMKVKAMYDTGKWSLRSLARVFRVSPACIKTIVVAGFADKLKAAHKGYMFYYNRDIHNTRIKSYRERKRSIDNTVPPGYNKIRQNGKEYFDQAAFERHQSSVCLIREGNILSLHSTYCKKSGALKAKARHIVPEDAIITTWRRLRVYMLRHPQESKHLSVELKAMLGVNAHI